jgi:hypothetical protein
MKRRIAGILSVLPLSLFLLSLFILLTVIPSRCRSLILPNVLQPFDITGVRLSIGTSGPDGHRLPSILNGVSVNWRTRHPTLNGPVYTEAMRDGGD